ncbi:hypothetical protein GJ654_11350 [Rhodoblastus acidophilus]|uniref:Uncharacterized protein n=1 Tax=Rhodoblastus acidophilus TaxID=1074 RepID=A0A6N8DM92_RHOAC|nr:hypothetical protein [Rhodoblastus acidophilus]MCW2276540.1 hypothetical protein [Rhodoblastus acidophilus]MTV31589.1 hypothetical protein [Rhodoblastus acidophilus]
MPTATPDLVPFPIYKHFASTCRLFNLRLQADYVKENVVFRHAMMCDMTRLSLSRPKASKGTEIVPYITKFYMSERFGAASTYTKEHYNQIAQLTEEYFSWLRIAAVFRLSELTKTEAALERALIDFSVITRVKQPTESVLLFIRKWREKPLQEVFDRVAERTMKEFCKEHPEV